MTEILMPRLSDTMEEGVISSWQKQPGDEVAVGDVLVDIETDKAVMEYEAYEAGVLEKILVGDGETAAIGAPIAVVVPKGASSGAAPAPAAAPEPEAAPKAEAAAESAPEPAAEAKPAEAKPAEAKPAAPAPAPQRTGASRPPASPLARRLARDHGIDLAGLSGSGPGGRIVRADIEAAVRSGG
ncbi:biotin/lipoyl-containing protein, partial [Actinomadura sp. LOL_016]|uniref:biotin/lipoyl-containing protein n=1 Tax=Actinomadura sp. LOL_016 TaxID=3345411 RepID=UPI003A836EFF